MAQDDKTRNENQDFEEQGEKGGQTSQENTDLNETDDSLMEDDLNS